MVQILTRGVNPATGLVVYYQLPELKSSESVVMEIKDAQGNLVRSFSSVKDTISSPPSTDPLLPKAKGLNRFVWNLTLSDHQRVCPGFILKAVFADIKPHQENIQSH